MNERQRRLASAVLGIGLGLVLSMTGKDSFLPWIAVFALVWGLVEVVGQPETDEKNEEDTER